MRSSGTTTVRFANGTRLLVKPTKFEKDKIQVSVSFGNGRAGVKPELAHSLWEAQLYPFAGTAKLSLGDVTKWAETTGKVASIGFEAGMRSFVLKGATRPADLTAQMEMLAAYARDPGFRPEAVEKAKSIAPMIGGQIEGNAGAVYFRGAQALTVGNDRRFETLPSTSDLTKVTATDLPALLKQPLGGQADVVMVGDVSVDDAIKATQFDLCCWRTCQAEHRRSSARGLRRNQRARGVHAQRTRGSGVLWRIFPAAGLFRRPENQHRRRRRRFDP